MNCAPNLDGRDLAIGIVRARFNETIGETELAACLERLDELHVARDRVTVVSVPGALEAPLALQRLAASGRFDALVALGAVIRGETYHFEIVSNESAAGITRVQLDTGVPVANGILTTEDEGQAEARARGKGRDCADAAVEMANLVVALRGLSSGEAESKDRAPAAPGDASAPVRRSYSQ